MDGTVFTADPGILRCRKTSKDLKGQKCHSEIAEGRQEMNGHQESGDGGPALGRKSIPLRKGPEQAFEEDSGASSFTQREKMDRSPQTFASESVQNSTPLQKPPFPNSPLLLGHDPYPPTQQFVSPHLQATSQMDHMDEVGAKEYMTWVHPKTGKVMKSRGQQTSQISELKPLLPPPSQNAQVSQDPKENEQRQLEARSAFSEGSKTGQHALQESCCRDQQQPRQQELQNGEQPETKLLSFEERHPEDNQVLGQWPKEQKLWNQSEKPTGPELAKPSRSSWGQPTKGADAEGNPALISKKTGLEMKCKSQQTSRIWEFKPLSAILHPSIPQSQESSDLKRGLESGTEGQIILPGKTKTGHPAAHESSRRISPLQEEKLPSSTHPEEPPKQLENPESLPIESINEAVVSREGMWTSLKSGLEMKCQSTQTGSMWEAKPLADILRAAGQESQQGKKVSEMGDELAQCLLDRGSKTNREMARSYTEGEPDVQQTYSLISQEEGMMFNNETHKILLSRGQQTNEALFPSPGGMARSDDEEAREGCEGQEKGELSSEGEQPNHQHSQEEKDIPGEVGTSQQLFHAKKKDLKSGDGDTENIPNGPHLSDEVLFHVESSFVIAPVDEDVPPIYEEEEGDKEGSFLNTQTGKLLESHCLQTDTLPFQNAEGEANAF
ncbi:hypothetical protein JRQ81_001291 [Phrynocephalus forsythii]|uniref:Uncharacterized protein n=1 Tax=Phrynocephalus forsythii TaxID=171643 RepID=A0A9Q0Y9P0_9SAUR|nr:hypothetical protein JRQ81_001291 [Phrynocephalus forsythii]